MIKKPHKQCRSAKDGIDMNILLQEIIDKDIYKKDYEDITAKMLFEDVPYISAIKALQRIVDYKTLCLRLFVCKKNLRK